MTKLSGSSVAAPCEERPFVVMVDDNFHYMDEDERWRLGAYTTYELAKAECIRLVETCLLEYYKPGMLADELYDMYVMFGDDPYILGDCNQNRFSAWDHAKERATALCAWSSFQQTELF